MKINKAILAAAVAFPITIGAGAAQAGATTTSSSGPVATNVATRYTYGAGTTNVRIAPNATAKVAGSLTAGITVTGTISRGWLQVSTPSAYAGKYISTTALTSAAPPASAGCLPENAVVKDGVGYNLCAGDTGIKVRLVRQALGLPIDSTVSHGTYDSATAQKVMDFQSSHNLYPNGVTDRATYASLAKAYPKSDLARNSFDVDGWVNPAAAGITSASNRAQRINAMVAWARKQESSEAPYVWGGTGPGGYDCAGLVLQAMRAGGFNPKSVSNWTDVRPSSDLSNEMWLDKEIRTVVSTPITKVTTLPQVGDLVFYGDSKGNMTHVHHVGIYIGSDTILSAVGSVVQHTSYKYDFFGWPEIVGIKRAF